MGILKNQTKSNECEYRPRIIDFTLLFQTSTMWAGAFLFWGIVLWSDLGSEKFTLDRIFIIKSRTISKNFLVLLSKIFYELYQKKSKPHKFTSGSKVVMLNPVYGLNTFKI